MSCPLTSPISRPVNTSMPSTCLKKASCITRANKAPQIHRLRVKNSSMNWASITKNSTGQDGAKPYTAIYHVR